MAYDTVGDLIKAFREDEKDAIAPYFWSDNQLVRWINEALTEFAERSLSIYDEESDVTLLSYAIDEDRFELDPSILDVTGAWVNGHRHAELSRGPYPFGYLRGGYLQGFNGCASCFHFDGAGILRLHPKPAAPGEIRLRVIRGPVRELEKCDRIQDVMAKDRRHLLSWMAYKAYRVNEGETYSIESSNAHLQRFEEACQEVMEKGIKRRGDCSRPIRSHF